MAGAAAARAGDTPALNRESMEQPDTGGEEQRAEGFEGGEDVHPATVSYPA